MNRWELLSFSDDQTLVDEAAKRWLSLSASAGASGPFLVALSGGRIPLSLYKAVVQNYPNQAHLLQALHFFWSDERCVPPDDPESNFAAANELLLKPLNIPGARTHRIRGEVEPSQAITQIEHDLAHLASRGDSGLPVFDLIFLGMGEDGHVASLFPGQLAESELKGTVYRQVIGPKPPPLRISLSYQVIAAAKQVWVLISGKGKEGALKQSLSGQTTPLGKVLAMRSQTLIFSSVAGL